jgi:hypothetical protein
MKLRERDKQRVRIREEGKKRKPCRGRVKKTKQFNSG